MKRIIKIYYIFAFLLMFGSSFVYSQTSLGRPFTSCYQQDFALCSNCSIETTGNITIPVNFQGITCDITVFYRMKTCDCPEPTVFIDLNYIKVNIYDCPDLICFLHPGPPEPPPSDNGCINNPLDQSNYDALEITLYKDLDSVLFQSIKSQFPCPEKMRFRKYAIASCKKVCGARLSAPGEPDAVVYVPKICNDEVCCYTDFLFCQNQYDETIWERLPSQLSEPCPVNPSGPPCLSVNDTVDILGITYTVTMVMNSECTAGCTNPLFLW